MKKLLFYNQGDPEEKARVTLIHSQPDNLSEERRKEGIEIEGMPQKDTEKIDNGYRALPYINLKTKEIFYEYIKNE